MVCQKHFPRGAQISSLFFGFYFAHDVQNPHNTWAIITTAEIKDTFTWSEGKKI